MNASSPINTKLAHPSIPRNSRNFCKIGLNTVLLAAVVATSTSPLLADKNSRPAPKGSASASTSEPRLRLRIAVDQFKWGEIRDDYNLPRDVKEGMNALLMDKLRESGYFQVMEREATAVKQGQVETQLDEKKRAQQPKNTRFVASARQTLTPASYIITPTVTGLQTSKRGGGGVRIGGIDFGDRSLEVMLSLNIRISDAQTGEILESATAEGKQKTKSSDLGIRLPGVRDYGKSDEKSTPFSQVVEKALDTAVQKIIKRLGNEPWSALVAKQDKNTGRVILATGTDAGLSIGMELAVYKAGDATIHPETGDYLTPGDEVQIGRVRIVRLDRNIAFCDVLEGKRFSAKNIARLVR